MKTSIFCAIFSSVLATAGCSSESMSGTMVDGGIPGDGGLVAPTISSWMGTNVAADLPHVDITYQLGAFDTAVAQKDAHGYPASGFSGTSKTDLGFVLPSGTYKISYKGTGQLVVSGIATLMGGWQSANGEQRGQLAIVGTPGNFGRFLNLAVNNGAGQSVTDIHIFYPGFDYYSTAVFLPVFLALLKPFRALRFMEWENINGSTLSRWNDRPASANFGASGYGQPYQHIAELINTTGKDGWLNVPELADDAFVHSLAQFFATHLDFTRIAAARQAQGFTTPFALMVESSNETWNSGFTAYKTFLTAANAANAKVAGTYSGTYAGTYGPSFMTGNSDLMKVGQYTADRLAKIAAIFRQEFAAMQPGSVISPVLSGWALGAAYSDVGLQGLQYIKAHYGDPKTIISRVATAPYFGPEEAQTAALGSLFTSANANIASMDTTFQAFAKLVNQYGLQMTAYEGGQGISGNTNLTIKHLSQHDQRMYDTYNAYFSLWQKNFGSALFMHFDLAGTPGTPEFIFQYGFWGSIISALEDPAVCSPNLPTLMGTESVAAVIHHCPKYRALLEQAPH